MRKTIHALSGTLTAAAFCAVLTVPHAAFATEPGVSEITITGAVPPITNLPTPTQSGGSQNATFSGNAVSIQELADASAHLKEAAITLLFENVTTNYPARIGVYSLNKGLKSGNTLVKYQATVESAPDLSFDCVFDGIISQCLSNITQSKIFRLDKITLDISTVVDQSTASAILPHGTYSDTLTLKVGTTL
jgi:hypothetical protein